MGKFDIDIGDNSVWVTATPVETNAAMPFYITEIGHFYAGRNYVTDRQGHESYMLIYTVKGAGYVEMDGFDGELHEGEAVIFNCRNPHYYRSNDEEWEFFWIHLNGLGVDGMVNAVNYSGIHIVNIENTGDFRLRIQQMINTAEYNDIQSLSAISTDIHIILNTMIRDSFCMNSDYTGTSHMAEIQAAVQFIEGNYMNAISIENITDHIHVSKYYFIRLFKQYMGMTPYSYLINYRINRSKILLRTENISVGEIAGKTGFSDVSNFITQFKKQTGQKPMDYRKRFA